MCGDIKPFDCFYKDKRASDGCQSRCKACWNELQRIKRATPEAKEYNRDYHLQAVQQTDLEHKDRYQV